MKSKSFFFSAPSIVTALALSLPLHSNAVHERVRRSSSHVPLDEEESILEIDNKINNDHVLENENYVSYADSGEGWNMEIVSSGPIFHEISDWDSELMELVESEWSEEDFYGEDFEEEDDLFDDEFEDEFDQDFGLDSSADEGSGNRHPGNLRKRHMQFIGSTQDNDFEGKYEEQFEDVFEDDHDLEHLYNSNELSNSSAATVDRRLIQCKQGQVQGKVDITVDNFGSETTWVLKRVGNNKRQRNLQNNNKNNNNKNKNNNSNNRVILKNSRTYSANDSESRQVCLSPGRYELILQDEMGDGICCQRGNGYIGFSLRENGKWEELFRGGFAKKTKVAYPITIEDKSNAKQLTDREKEYLIAHNTRRQKWHKKYNKPYVPLRWSHSLQQISQKYAEALLDSCPSPTIKHDPNNNYGENLAKNMGTGGWGELKTPDAIVGRFIDREVGLPWPKNAHLVQALWRPTRYVACAESEKPLYGGMCRIQVCRYSRVGNCNIGKNGQNWKSNMVEDISWCEPTCPPGGCT